MNSALWIAQGVMVETGQTGTAMYPLPVVRFTASMELLAAAGLILPWATGIAKVLTPLAALGLCAVMIGAASAHARLHEPRNIAVTPCSSRCASLSSSAGRRVCPDQTRAPLDFK